MLLPGLVSITFRQLGPAAIIELVRTAGGRAIEWGGDIHVPHGDLVAARQVGDLTRAAGLEVAAYGAYYRLAVSETDGLPFARVLATALALGAPLVRVWAGNRSSQNADAASRAAVVADARRVAAAAHTAGIAVACEFHGGTLTDTNESARRFYSEVDHPNLKAYWQPPVGDTVEYGVAGLRSLLPRLANIHAFHWGPTPAQRQPLSAGAEPWRKYLAVARTTGQRHHVLLEYVADDDPANFTRDLATLREWLA
jgi:sugar phosphate isomerase/epimerase